MRQKQATARVRLEQQLDYVCERLDVLQQQLTRLEAHATEALLQTALEQQRQLREMEASLEGQRAALRERRAHALEALQHQQRTEAA